MPDDRTDTATPADHGDVSPRVDDALAEYVVDAFRYAVAAGKPPAAAARGLACTSVARVVLAVPGNLRDETYWAEHLGFYLTVATIQRRHGVLDPEWNALAYVAARTALREATSTVDATGRIAAKAYLDEERRERQHRARRTAADVPPRLLPGSPDPVAYARLTELVPEIISRLELGDEGRLDGMLAEWNALATRTYTAREISRYDSWTSKEVFVGYALAGRAAWLVDLTFDEVRRAVEALRGAGLPEVDAFHVMAVLEHNLPGSGLSDLMNWPRTWFGDEALPHLDLTAEQVVAYAAGRAGRRLDGTPDVELPLPDPKAHRSGSGR